MLLDELTKRGLRLHRGVGGDHAGETRIVASDPQLQLAYSQVCAADAAVGVSIYTIRRWVRQERMAPQDVKLLLVLLEIATARAWSDATQAHLADAVGISVRKLQEWMRWHRDGAPDGGSALWQMWQVCLQVEQRPGGTSRLHICTTPVIHPDDLATLDLMTAPGNPRRFCGGVELTPADCGGVELTPADFAGVRPETPAKSSTNPPPSRDLIDPPLRFLGAGGGGSLRGRSESSTQTVALGVPEMPPPPPPNSLREGDGGGEPDYALQRVLNSHADAPHWVARWTAVDPLTGHSWLSARNPAVPTKFLEHVVKRACEGDATCRRAPREYEQLASQAESRAERERRAARRIVQAPAPAHPVAATTPDPMPAPITGELDAIASRIGPVYASALDGARILPAAGADSRPRLVLRYATLADGLRRRLTDYHVTTENPDDLE